MLKSDAILCTRWAKLYRRSIIRNSAFDCPSNLRVGEDMIMNIRIAFSTKQNVTILHSKVYNYNRNEKSVSSTWKWNNDKHALLYKTLRETIPQQRLMPEYQYAVIKNGFNMVRSTVVKGDTGEWRGLKDSEVLKLLKEDIIQWGYQTNMSKKALLNHPSALWSRCFFRSIRLIEIGKQIIQRHIFGK